MGELTIQLAIVFVGKQFLNQFQEVAIPKLQETWNRKNEIAAKTALQGKYLDMKKMKKPPQWAKDDALPKTDATMFEEYRELVIQFGFCTLFVTAFPVAPIFALLNNVLEIRVDAYKLLTRHRRPIAQPVQDIGSWSTIMVFITYISVWTNACLIAFQSDWMEINVFRKVSWVQADVGDHTNYGLLAVRLLFIFIFEHVVFLAKAFISKLVRDVPRTVKLAIDRENYYTRLALDDEEPAVDEALEDLDDDEDESEDEDDFRKKLLNLEESVEERAAAVAANLGIGEDEVYDEEEEAEELEALIKAGGCGCAARGDGILGTVKGGFDATWMSRFRPEAAQAVLRRRQQRRRKKQNAQAKNGKEE
ncbi:Anoctamin-7 [Entomortierella lignicola]|nr:Anoctamin-7 [Entomortierella lignicola]